MLENNEAFETKSEKGFHTALKTAEKEAYKEAIEEHFTLFKKAVAKEKIQELEANKAEILERLTEEIVKRYYFKEGVFQQKLAFDPSIVQATELLHNTKEYSKLLK